MTRSVIPVQDDLDSGELSSLIGIPVHDNGDVAELCLTTDEWSALIERRRRVRWPLRFLEHRDAR